MKKSVLISVYLWFQILSAVGTVRADGGQLLLRREAGAFVITVFATPFPLRVGLLDLSVMIQDHLSQEPILDGYVSLQLSKNGHHGVSMEATRQHAQNKLLYAASFNIPEPGLWNLQLLVRRGLQSAAIDDRLNIDPAPSPLISYWPYFALPPVLIALFLLHQRLKKKPQAR